MHGLAGCKHKATFFHNNDNCLTLKRSRLCIPSTAWWEPHCAVRVRDRGLMTQATKALSLQLMGVIHQRSRTIASSAPRLSSLGSSLRPVNGSRQLELAFTALPRAPRTCSMTIMGQWHGWKGQSALLSKYARTISNAVELRLAEFYF